tara:strand:+ start:469 stop:702 length:234 start_codon:yes stop_codon:yes gene_type:complete
MKYLIPLLLIGCASRAKLTGTVLDDQMYFNRMVPVEVINAPDSATWVKLNKRQLKYVKPGDKVVFYVKTVRVEYESR